MSIKNKIASRSAKIMLALGVSSLALTQGCQGPPARTIDTGSSESITSIDHIDDQDWSKAAQKLTVSMLGTENLFVPNGDGSKKRLAISRVINNTAENIDTDLLIKQIRVTLFKAGKVVVTTTGGLTVEDPLAKKNKDVAEFEKGEVSPTVGSPDYSLSGKLIENRTKAGDIRQSTFYFQMTLTDKNGDSVWEDQTPITKIGEHNAAGI